MMKTIQLLAVAFLILCNSAIAFAQKKHFEGEITYTVSITMDKTMRKFIKDADGEYKVRTIYKNGNEKTVENYFGTTNYIFRDRDSVYVYNPATKTGYKCTYSKSVEDYASIRNPSESFKSTVGPTGETKIVNGITFEHFKGQEKMNMDILGTTIVSTEDLDYWVNQDYDENYLMSIRIPGLYTDLDYTSRFRVPLFGEGVQHVSIKMHEVNPREVKDLDFALPSDITFTEVYTQNQAEKAIKKDYKKYTKKLGKKKGEDVKTTGASEVKGEWDF